MSIECVEGSEIAGIMEDYPPECGTDSNMQNICKIIFNASYDCTNPSQLPQDITKHGDYPISKWEEKLGNSIGSATGAGVGGVVGGCIGGTKGAASGVAIGSVVGDEIKGHATDAIHEFNRGISNPTTSYFPDGSSSTLEHLNPGSWVTTYSDPYNNIFQERIIIHDFEGVKTYHPDGSSSWFIDSFPMDYP